MEAKGKRRNNNIKKKKVWIDHRQRIDETSTQD